MHEELGLQYERRWLGRFGLSYYGCCEALHDRIDLLKTIPNLRKISASPWTDIGRDAEAVGHRYVLSYKPNPAILAGACWDPVRAKRRIESDLSTARVNGCAVEIVLKDTSTVLYEPRRLWERTNIAMEAAERYRL
jgi:hypothetical protein